MQNCKSYMLLFKVHPLTDTGYFKTFIFLTNLILFEYHDKIFCADNNRPFNYNSHHFEVHNNSLTGRLHNIQ